MKYITHNDRSDVQYKTNGSCCHGYIDCTYDQLVKAFSQPTVGDEYKVDAEWIIQFDDDKIATIYNYKDGVNYLGAEGKFKEDITNWHIGGHDKIVVDRIHEIINTAQKG